jgi:DNA mismatch repair protein MutL
MSKIRFLTQSEIRMIAAGEVIERPASIIKEILENSIDAKSENIHININNGGIDLIEIKDNGNGINKEDLEICILPHTTSKLESVHNIYTGINTYGFRGEALAAIASISHIEITSKEKDSDIANKITCYAGNIIKKEIIGAPIGTNILIKDIFMPVPARRKYLKSKETEWNFCEHIIIGGILANPKINFSISKDNKNYLILASDNSLIDRAFKLIDKENLNKMIECKYQDENLKIEGIISGIEYGYHDRSKIYVLINNRIIKQYKITQSIIKGYKSENFSNRYPIIYLSITISKDQVDVNVHPRKEEVGFQDPKKIENSITKAIIKTLEERTKKILFSTTIKTENKTEINKEKTEDQKNKPIKDKIIDYEKTINENQINNEKIIIPKKIILEEKLKIEIKNDFFKNENITTNNINNEISEKNLNEKTLIYEQKSLIDYEYVFNGIFSKTYLMFIKHQSILFIDQHALHEKIIFEKLKKESEEKHIKLLIQNECLFFEKKIIDLISKNIDLFKYCLIECDIFDETTLVIKGYSKTIKEIGVKNAIEIILFNIKEKKEIIYEKIKYEILAQIACKNAIKAGQSISENEIKILIENSNKYNEVSLCPHGRPTFYELKKDSLDSLFKRK